MLHSVSAKMSSLLAQKNERSELIWKNVLISFVVKGGGILVGLLLVPITLDYVNPVKYGVWLTISSVVSWMTFFDVGMGNGLRNKLAHSLALKEYDEAKAYISTTYIVLLLISLGLFLIFNIVNPIINWNRLLNIPETVSEDIQVIILIVFSSFCIQFIVQIINVVLAAQQQPSKAALISFIGQLGVLLAIVVVQWFVTSSLTALVLVLTVVPVVVTVFASSYLYRTKLNSIAPSMGSVDFKYAKNLVNVGSLFFIIQIGALVLFQTNNMVIAQVLGPGAVTEFNVSYKLFSIVIMVFSIIVTPYWSAFTDAYAKEDFQWLESNLKLIRKIWLIISFTVVPVLCLLSKNLFSIWVGDSVSISWPLSISMAVYVIGFTGLMLNCYFLNGIGKVRVQFLLYLVVCILNIPLSVFLCKSHGVVGVVISNIIAFSIMTLILWIQSDKILRGKAFGIWNS